MTGWLRRIPVLTPLALALAPLISGSAAQAKPLQLTQLHGKAGCVAQQDAARSVRRDCAVKRFGGGQIWALAVSPDGRNVYVASLRGAVSVLRIRNGRLHQLRGQAGCLSVNGRLGCRRVRQLGRAEGIAISPDGRSVYVAAARGNGTAGGVVAFGRNRRTGALHETGCLGEGGANGCAPARGILRRVAHVAVSRDGHSVYVASNSADAGAVKNGAVAVFARSAVGALSQLAGAAGCASSGGAGGCATARALLPECCGIAIAPDSRNVYLSSSQVALVPGSLETKSASFALSSFSRDGASGALTQMAGPAACVNKDGSFGCAVAAFAGANPVNRAGNLVMSPNGRDLYLAHSSSFPEAEAAACGGDDSFIALFRRDPAGGGLGPLAQDRRSCGGEPLISRDGRSVYAVTGSFGSVVNGFSRKAGTGLLTPAGCLTRDLKGCRRPRHVTTPTAIAITPNGRYVYVVSDDPVLGESIGVFRRRAR